MSGRKYFDARKSHDFRIRDDDGLTHSLRVKPNAIAIKGRHAQKYYQVTIEEFMAWAEENGTEVNR